MTHGRCYTANLRFDSRNGLRTFPRQDVSRNGRFPDKTFHVHTPVDRPTLVAPPFWPLISIYNLDFVPVSSGYDLTHIHTKIRWLSCHDSKDNGNKRTRPIALLSPLTCLVNFVLFIGFYFDLLHSQ